MLFTPCEYSMLIQGLGVSLFIFSLAKHAAGVPTVITHPEFNHSIHNSYTNKMPNHWRMINKYTKLDLTRERNGRFLLAKKNKANTAEGRWKNRK